MVSSPNPRGVTQCAVWLARCHLLNIQFLVDIVLVICPRLLSIVNPEFTFWSTNGHRGLVGLLGVWLDIAVGLLIYERKTLSPALDYIVCSLFCVIKWTPDHSALLTINQVLMWPMIIFIR